MSNSGDTPMEDEEYEHGEELLLDGAKKLMIVSVANFSTTSMNSMVED